MDVSAKEEQFQNKQTLEDKSQPQGTSSSRRTVRTKFRVSSYETVMQQGVECRSIKMQVVYDGSPENKEFFKYSPSGQISIGLLNPTAWKQFELDKEYYVDFSPAS